MHVLLDRGPRLPGRLYGPLPRRGRQRPLDGAASAPAVDVERREGGHAGGGEPGPRGVVDEIPGGLGGDGGTPG